MESVTKTKPTIPDEIRMMREAFSIGYNPMPLEETSEEQKSPPRQEDNGRPFLAALYEPRLAEADDLTMREIATRWL